MRDADGFLIGFVLMTLAWILAMLGWARCHG